VPGRHHSVGVAGGMAALWHAQATPGVSPSEDTSTPLHHGTRGHLSGMGQGYVQQGYGLSLLMSPRPFPRPAPQSLLNPTLSQPVPHV
jgi:hypothetical protein